VTYRPRILSILAACLALSAFASTPSQAAAKIQHLVSPGGIEAWFVQDATVPLIAMEAVVRGGASIDRPALAGVASLTAELLTRGAGERDAYSFAESVEDVGGSLEAQAHSEAVLVHGQFLARDRELMLTLLADALQRPHFEAEEFEMLRDRRIEFIRAAKDSEPQSLIGAYGRSMLFARHAYGVPISGSERTLAALRRDHLLDFFRQQFGADRLTLVFAGDFDPEWMRQAVAAHFEHWSPAPEPLQPLEASRRVRHVPVDGFERAKDEARLKATRLFLEGQMRAGRRMTRPGLAKYVFDLDDVRALGGGVNRGALDYAGELAHVAGPLGGLDGSKSAWG